MSRGKSVVWEVVGLQESVEGGGGGLLLTFLVVGFGEDPQNGEEKGSPKLEI